MSSPMGTENRKKGQNVCSWEAEWQRAACSWLVVVLFQNLIQLIAGPVLCQKSKDVEQAGRENGGKFLWFSCLSSTMCSPGGAV